MSTKSIGQIGHDFCDALKDCHSVRKSELVRVVRAHQLFGMQTATRAAAHGFTHKNFKQQHECFETAISPANVNVTSFILASV